MRSTPVAALCIALLTVTAGCGGFLGGDDGPPTRDPYDVDPTPTRTATPTETPEAGTPLASAAFRTAVANHTDALRRAGNFTIRRTRRSGRVIDGADPEPFTQVAKVDLAADRYALGDAPNGTGSFGIEAYQSGEQWYRLTGGTVRNYTGSDDDRFTPRQAALQLTNFLPNRSVQFPFERNGTATFDGEEMRRFTAADPGYFRGAYTQVENVTQFRATALVDDRGIVRKFTYTLRGRTATNATYVESETVVVTDVGSTSVRPLGAVIEGDEPGGSVSLQEVAANHTGAVRRAGNFTVRRVRVSGPTDPNTVRRRLETDVVVDLAADRYLVRREQNGSEGRIVAIRYQNATGVYARSPATDGFENVTGRVGVTPNELQQSLVRRIPNQSLGVGFEPKGTIPFEGEEMRRFTTTDPGSFRGTTQRLRSVDDFRATFLVDDRGIVRKFTYTIVGETYDGESYLEHVDFEVVEVGTTTVSPPEGLGNASTTASGGE